MYTTTTLYLVYCLLGLESLESENFTTVVTMVQLKAFRPVGVSSIPVPLLLGLLGHPGGHADDGRGEEEGGGQVEGGVLTTRVVHQPAGQGRS